MSSEKYSMIKYGISTKNILSKYEKLSDAQKYRYKWFAEKLGTNQNVLYAALGAEFAGVSCAYDSTSQVMDEYYKFKSRREGMSHFLKNDAVQEEICGGFTQKSLIISYVGKKISPEYVILKHEQNNFLDAVLSDPEFLWAKPQLLKVNKYRDFFNHQKYQHLIYHEEAVA